MRRLAPLLLIPLVALIAWAAPNQFSGYASSYAMCYLSSGSGNTPTTDTPELVASTWAIGSSSTGWTVTTGGRLTYSGTETRSFRFVYTGGVNSDAAANGDRCSLYIAEGGTPIAESVSDWDGQASGVHTAICVSWIDAEVSAGDYYELWVSIDNDASAPTITVDHGVWSVWGGR